MIFESNRREPYDLFIHRLGQRNAEPLVLDPGFQVMPMVSPDGQWVVYLSDRPAKWTLMRVLLKGGTPEPVPAVGKVEEFSCMCKAKGCVLREFQSGQLVFYDLDLVRGKGRELTRVSAKKQGPNCRVLSSRTFSTNTRATAGSSTGASASAGNNLSWVVSPCSLNTSMVFSQRCCAEPFNSPR